MTDTTHTDYQAIAATLWKIDRAIESAAHAIHRLRHHPGLGLASLPHLHADVDRLKLERSRLREIAATQVPNATFRHGRYSYRAKLVGVFDGKACIFRAANHTGKPCDEFSSCPEWVPVARVTADAENETPHEAGSRVGG